MKTIKKTVTILVLAMVTMAFTNKTIKTNKPVETKTYYYYAYATTGVNNEIYDKVWITPVKKITINDDSYYEIGESGLALQFQDYMEAHYNFSASDVLDAEGETFEVEYFSEAEVTKSYRETLKRFKSVRKIYDFSYKKERR